MVSKSINIFKAIVYSLILLVLYIIYLSSSKKNIIDEDLKRLTNINSVAVIKQLLLNKKFSKYILLSYW